ncbi:MAG: hypothetical protein ACYC9Z_16320 [Casimicrobiaceae bacterium]
MNIPHAYVSCRTDLVSLRAHRCEMQAALPVRLQFTFPDKE